MKKELPGFELNEFSADSMWETIVRNLLEEPDSIQPVHAVDEMGTSLGTFYVTMPKIEGKQYMQLEGFDSPEFGEAFLKTSTSDWQIFPGGIYRLELSSNLKTTP